MHADSSGQWACPRDGHTPLGLSVIERTANDILEGIFECAQCKASFPIHHGIPNFLCLEEEASAAIKRSEIEARDHDPRLPIKSIEVYEARVEVEAVLSRLRVTTRDRVLDVGCGLGRITQQVLAQGAQVVAVDFSPVRLEFLRDKTRASDRIDLAVADANHLPIAPGHFTKILSTQVLEHLPTPNQRSEFVQKLYDLLGPGGTLVLTVYNYDSSRQRFGEPKEGYHDSGIFYHCYTADELRAEFRGGQKPEICGIVHHLRGTYKLQFFPRLGALGRAMDHALEKIPALNLRYGSLLLAQAQKR